MRPPVGIEYRPDWHFVTPIPFEGTARNILPMYDVFTYRHAVTGNWMVAHWIKRWVHMQELISLGKNPVGSREAVMKLERFRPCSQADANRAANREDLTRDDLRWRKGLQQDADEMEMHIKHVRQHEARGHKRHDWPKLHFGPPASGQVGRKTKRK